MMSNWPPLVAISVVTRWRSTFSSSTTQLILLPVACSHFGASFCMMIMSALLTVAMVTVAACAKALAPRSAPANAARNPGFSMIVWPPLLNLSECSPHGRTSHSCAV